MLKRFGTVNLAAAFAYLLASALGYWACHGNAEFLTVKPAFGVAAVVGWFWPEALPAIGLAALVSYAGGLQASLMDSAVFGLTQALGAGCIRPLFKWLSRTVGTGHTTEEPAFWAWLACAVGLGAIVAAIGNTWFLPNLREPVTNRVLFFALAGAIAGMSALGAVLNFGKVSQGRISPLLARNITATALALVVFASSAHWLMAQGTLAVAALIVLGAGILILDGASFSVLAFCVTLFSAQATAGASAPANLLLGGYRVDVPLFIVAMLGLVLISCRERGVTLTRKLHEQTYHAAAVISALPDLVTIQNREGDYVATVSEQHNIPALPQNLTGQNVRDLMPADYASRRIALVERVIDTQTPQAEKIPVVLEGKRRWIEARGVPYGENLCLMVTREITAENEAVEQLRLSEAHNRAVVEALSDRVVVLDAAGVVTNELTVAQPTPGKLTDVWLNKVLAEFLPASTAETVVALVQEVLKAGESRTCELHVKASTGSVWWLVRMVPYGENQVLASIRDVTAERAANEEARHHKQMMTLIEDNIRELIILQDAVGTFSYVSPSCKKMFGLEPDWLTEARFLERVAYRDLQQLLAMRAEIISGARTSGRLEFQFRHNNGEKVWVSQELMPVHDENGNVTHVLSAARDITERKEHLDQMRLAQIAVDGIRDGMMVTDVDGQILWVNRKFSDITGFASDAVVGRNERDTLISDFTPEHRLHERREKLEREGGWVGELMTRREDGTTFSEHRTMSTVQTEDGNELVLSLMSDLSVERAREEMLWQASTQDALTNVATLSFFREAMDYASAHALKSRRKVALLTIGLSRFAQVAESYGRHEADQLLKDVAARLTNGVREEDLVGRVGDSVFAVLSEEMRGNSEINGQATRLLELFSTPFKVADQDVYEQPYIGISIFPDHGEDPEELLSHSRSAMEEARATSNVPTYRPYTKSLHQRERERIRLETHLRRALHDGNELSLAYQPQISFSTGRIEGFEALCRWKSAQLGDVQPDVFIPVAEASGLINDLGTWSIDAACQRLKIWQKAGLQSTMVSVNLSPRQFRASMLVPQIASALERANLDPRLLHLEITEASLKEGWKQAAGVLKQLKDTGVQLILDDFGTGYSNLEQVLELPLDGIKIDGSFVSKLTTNSPAVAVCEAVIKMAQKLGIRTIAKSVETVEQRQILKSLGCDAFQGYLFSPAVSEQEARALLVG